jgi:hypothetical protein
MKNPSPCGQRSRFKFSGCFEEPEELVPLKIFRPDIYRQKKSAIN